MADINLLAEEAKQFESFDNLKNKLSIVAVVLMVLTAIATLATLAYFTSLISDGNKLVARIETASAKVNNYKQTEVLAVVTKEKAAVADRIVIARPDRVKVFNALAQIVPQNVSFADVKIAQGKIVIAGKARTSADMAALVSALVSEKGSAVVSEVSVDSLASGENGIYTFGISARLIK